jgi:hypothetical protein
MRHTLLFILICLFGTQSVVADSSVEQFSNTVSSTWSYGDNTWYQGQFKLDSEATGTISKEIYFNLKSRLVGDLKQQIDPERSSFEFVEAYVSSNWNDIQLRLGKQIHNWSQMDGLTTFEQLSPRDYSQFILLDHASSAIGQWMLSVSDTTSNGQWQFIWVPQAKYHRLPENSDWFAFRASRLRFGFPFTGQTASTLQYKQINQGLLAARYQSYHQGWQWSTQMRFGADFEPLARYSRESGYKELELYHEQRLSLGGALSANLGDQVLRSELSISPNRVFNTNHQGNVGETEGDQVSFALGMDTNGPWDTFINVQVQWDAVLDHMPDLVRPSHERIWSVLTRKGFDDDLVQLELRWYGSSSDDGLLRSSIRKNLNDMWDVKIGLDVFYGTQQGLFGQYNQLDRLYLQLTGYF